LILELISSIRGERKAMGRYGSDDFGQVPSWAIAEMMRRAEARRRAEAERSREAAERQAGASLRWRRRRERFSTFLGSLRPSRSAGPAEA